MAQDPHSRTHLHIPFAHLHAQTRLSRQCNCPHTFAVCNHKKCGQCVACPFVGAIRINLRIRTYRLHTYPYALERKDYSAGHVCCREPYQVGLYFPCLDVGSKSAFSEAFLFIVLNTNTHMRLCILRLQILGFCCHNQCWAYAVSFMRGAQNPHSLRHSLLPFAHVLTGA